MFILVYIVALFIRVYDNRKLTLSGENIRDPCCDTEVCVTVDVRDR